MASIATTFPIYRHDSICTSHENSGEKLYKCNNKPQHLVMNSYMCFISQPNISQVDGEPLWSIQTDQIYTHLSEKNLICECTRSWCNRLRFCRKPWIIACRSFIYFFMSDASVAFVWLFPVLYWGTYAKESNWSMYDSFT